MSYSCFFFINGTTNAVQEQNIAYILKIMAALFLYEGKNVVTKSDGMKYGMHKARKHGM